MGGAIALRRRNCHSHRRLRTWLLFASGVEVKAKDNQSNRNAERLLTSDCGKK
jgi:hypothetical protein